MRVLLFTYEFYPFAGGIGVYTRGLAKGLANLGHNVYVLAPKYKDDHDDWDTSQPFRVLRFPRFHNVIKFFWGSCWLLFTLLKYKPDHVFGTEKRAVVSAMIALRFMFKKPAVFGIIKIHKTAVKNT